MLLGTLSASLLGILLTRWGVNRAGKSRGIDRAGEWVLRAGYGNKKGRKRTKLIFNATSSFN